MKLETTNRGFGILNFKDRYGNECSLQESSLARERCIWLGITDAKPQIMASKTPQGGTGWVDFEIPEDVFINSRMHLTQQQVKELIPILERFVATGYIDSLIVGDEK